MQRSLWWCGHVRWDNKINTGHGRIFLYLQMEGNLTVIFNTEKKN